MTQSPPADLYDEMDCLGKPSPQAPATDAEAPPKVDLRPHVIAYLANNLRTNGYEIHARTMEALAAMRDARSGEAEC